MFLKTKKEQGREEKRNKLIVAKYIINIMNVVNTTQQI